MEMVVQQPLIAAETTTPAASLFYSKAICEDHSCIIENACIDSELQMFKEGPRYVIRLFLEDNVNNKSATIIRDQVLNAMGPRDSYIFHLDSWSDHHDPSSFAWHDSTAILNRFVNNNCGHLLADDVFAVFRAMRIFQRKQRQQSDVEVEKTRNSRLTHLYYNSKRNQGCDSYWEPLLINPKAVLTLKRRRLKSQCYHRIHVGLKGLGFMADQGVAPHRISTLQDDMMTFRNQFYDYYNVTTTPTTTSTTSNNHSSINRILLMQKEEGSHLSRLGNLTHIQASLQHYFPRYNTTIVSWSRLPSTHDQIQLLSQTRAMISLPGADILNAIFLPNNNSALLLYCRIRRDRRRHQKKVRKGGKITNNTADIVHLDDASNDLNGWFRHVRHIHTTIEDEHCSSRDADADQSITASAYNDSTSNVYYDLTTDTTYVTNFKALHERLRQAGLEMMTEDEAVPSSMSSPAIRNNQKKSVLFNEFVRDDKVQEEHHNKDIVLEFSVPTANLKKDLPSPFFLYSLGGSGLGSQILNFFSQTLFFREFHNRTPILVESDYGYRRNASLGVLSGFFRPQFPVISTKEEHALVEPYLDGIQLDRWRTRFPRGGVWKNLPADMSALSRNKTLWLLGLKEYRDQVFAHYDTSSVEFYHKLRDEMCPSMQFNDRTKREIEQLRKAKQLPLHFGSGSPAAPSVAFHVRRTDKVWEASLSPANQYVQKLMEVLSATTPVSTTFSTNVSLSRSKIQEIQSCYVSTDNYTAVLEMEVSLRAANFTCRVYSMPPREDVSDPASRETSYEALTLWTEISILVESTYFVGTFTSNMGLMVAVLRGCSSAHVADPKQHDPPQHEKERQRVPHNYYANSFAIDMEQWQLN